MKLIIAIVREPDGEAILQALVDAHYRVTRIASTGGFLRRGHTTLLIGVEADEVQKAIQLVRDHCAPQVDPGTKRATVFVLAVDRFEQL
jgi:uncharacterized protein YaaQ